MFGLWHSDMHDKLKMVRKKEMFGNTLFHLSRLEDLDIS